MSACRFSRPGEAMAVPLKVFIHSLCNEPFDLDVLDTETVSDLRSMLFERLGFDPTKRHLKLIFGTTVLDDPTATLSAYNLKTGCSLTMLVENPGPNVLSVLSIKDSTVSRDLRAAARSKELAHPVSSIEVSAGTFQDQEWGNTKSALFLTLKDADKVLVRRNLYGTYRSQDYPHGPHPPAISFTESDDIVSQAKPGCFYQMEYRVGDGGGHRIEVKHWFVKIFYVSSSCTEASDVVNFNYDDERHFNHVWESEDEYIFDSDGVDI